MSLLSPELIAAAICPDRVILARAQGGLRPKLLQREEIAVSAGKDHAPSWQAAVQVLGERLAASAMARADVSVILSNHFVRYLVAPGTHMLRGRGEEQVHARHCFQRVYGNGVAAWALKSSAADPRKPRLVCGVEQSLITALEGSLAPLGQRYRALELDFVRSFNSCRQRLGDFTGWFVVVEQGLMCVALLVQGKWRSVRSLRIDAGWQDALPGLLDREELFVEDPAECERVAVYAPGSVVRLAPQVGKWRIEVMSASARPDTPDAGAAACVTAQGS